MRPPFVVADKPEKLSVVAVSFTSLGEGGGTRSVTEGVLQRAKLPQSPFGDSPLTEGAENNNCTLL